MEFLRPGVSSVENLLKTVHAKGEFVFTHKGCREVTRDIVVGDLSYKVDADRNQPFWDAVQSGRWEPHTFQFFRTHIAPDVLVLDVGAWIGPTALFAAQLGAKCIAFEPDPKAFVELEENYRANSDATWIDRLSIVNAAVTVDGEPITLGSRAGGGDSMSSALFADQQTSWIAQSKRLQDILREHREPGQPLFIKIDIEGGEYSLLPAIKEILAEDGVRVHLSIHGKFITYVLRKKFSHLIWPLRFLAVRFAFFQKHRLVMASLPRHKSLRARGNAPLRMPLLKAAIIGRFPKEIEIV